MSYTDFFKRATRTEEQPDGLKPFPYQCHLALAEKPWPELLDVPTRMGKTAVLTCCDVALISTKLSKSERVGESEKVDKLTSDDVKTYLKALADRVLAAHQPGTITLAILNTVERAQGRFVELENRKQPRTAAYLATHLSAT